MTSLLQRFPSFLQSDSSDCGPTCLKMIATHYRLPFNIHELREDSGRRKDGVNLLGIRNAAARIGLNAIGARVTLDNIARDIQLPCIGYWNQNHFIVIYRITGKHVYVADPAQGKVKYTLTDFKKKWATKNAQGQEDGVVLLLEPIAGFVASEEAMPDTYRSGGFEPLFRYLKNYKKEIRQVFVGILLIGFLQLTLPFLTQAIVDVGIAQKNIHFIYLILFAQIMLFTGKTVVEFIRGWLLLHINTKVFISLLGDFLHKLMRLPVRFFESKITGDILQRLADHQRIEVFLTESLVNFLFSAVTIVIFSIVLAIYNHTIFFIFFGSSLLYALWVTLFLSKRKVLDYKRFEASSRNQSAILQIVNGMQDIKLNNAEFKKRGDWEKVQAVLFHCNNRSLAISQLQQAGTYFISEGKNLFISFLAAKFVIEGTLSLGEMLAIQYIIGQLSVPVEHLMQFIKTAQDALLSLNRLSEIHEEADEERPQDNLQTGFVINDSIFLDHITFSYPGAGSQEVLSDINLVIPKGKTTAIVGMSGSGKTTLLKLLMKFYDPDKGAIRLQNTDIKHLSHSAWRTQCGVVMQDGFIFSDSILNNIAVHPEDIDQEKLHHAIQMANLSDFIAQLPLGLNTKIGPDGNGISQGQRQRILIARSIYKDPNLILFDEATNALDANNERIILEGLGDFFKGRTVVVVAHRLSTVRNADQIVVMDKGKLIETGTHDTLIAERGAYFHLVKNQLELGN